MNVVRNELLDRGVDISLVRLCGWLEVPRSSVYYQPRERTARSLDQGMVSAVRKVIDAFPTFGIRRVWAYLRFRLKHLVNRKKTFGGSRGVWGAGSEAPQRSQLFNNQGRTTHRP